MLPRLMITKSRNLKVLALCLSVGLSIGLARGVPADKPEPLGQNVPWQDARLLAEVLERVEREYVDPVDDHQLLQAAIRGMVSSLDPYSAYLDGDEYDDIKIIELGRVLRGRHRGVDGGRSGRGRRAVRRLAGGARPGFAPAT